MTLTWFKNLVGLQLTEDQLRQASHPYVEVHAHVLIKSIQAFGLLGTVLIGPLSALLHANTRNIDDVATAALWYGTRGVVLGCMLGPLMTFGRLLSVKATKEAVVDRCYRLRINRTQVNVDRGSVIGAMGGALCALQFGADPCLGALVGMSAGILVMSVLNVVAFGSKAGKAQKQK